MGMTSVVELRKELRRLAIAGSNLSANDPGLNKLLPDIKKAGAGVPVFARLADSLDGLVDPGSGGTPNKLLEVATLSNALLYTQGSTGIEGEINVPGDTVPDIPTRASYKAVCLVKKAMEKRGSERMELLQAIYDEGKFVDLKLLGTFMEALYNPNGEVADFVAEKILPAYGEAILPELLKSYDVKGKMGDGRKLELIGSIMKEKGRDIYLEALRRGSASVKVSALRCLRRVPECEDIIVEQSRAKNESLRAEAFKILASMDIDAAADRLAEALVVGELKTSGHVRGLLPGAGSPRLVRRLIALGEECLTYYEGERAMPDVTTRFEAILYALHCLNTDEVREFFKKCKAKPECLGVFIAELRQSESKGMALTEMDRYLMSGYDDTKNGFTESFMRKVMDWFSK